MNNDPGATQRIPEEPKLLAGRYRLLDKIGEGGAAEVYRARDTRLDRVVAIKLLRRQYTYEEASRQRFVNEAKAAAGLSHPNVVDVYDFGETEDGTMFLAMRFIEGSNVKEVLQKRGRLTPAEAVAIAVQACKALSAAHARGLIHRDVKPQNMMVDPRGNVHLTDFGVAKALSGPALTQSGMTFGTAAYLSPEQATGDPVGPASDIYALGCVMYEMLSGTPPFTGDNPAVVAYKQVWERPRPLHDLVPEVPPSLEAVVMRCLEKEPSRRYQSADALAADLERMSAAFNQPTQAVPLGQVAQIAGTAAAGHAAGRWPRAESVLPAEQSRAFELPAAPPPQPAAGPPGYSAGYAAQQPSVPVPRVPATAARPVARQVNVQTRRGGGWAVAALIALLLLVLGGGGLWLLLGGGGIGPGPAATPTATVGSIGVVPTETPVPATNTPAAPTETATPEVTPTETPAPPTETPTAEPVPTDTPEPLPTDTPEALPTEEVPPPPTEDVPPTDGVRIEDNEFDGGFTNSDGLYHGVTARWVYGQGTPYNTMSVSFEVPAEPRGRGELTIVGLDSEDPEKNPVSITLNGVPVHLGPNPLPNDFDTGAQGPGNWGSFTWDLGPGILLAGQNTLTITNLNPSDCTNCPAFVMVDRVSVNWRTNSP